MSRITGIVIAISIVCGVASAERIDTRLGFKAGMNINRLVGSDNEGLGSSIGFNVSAELRSRPRNVSVQPEMSYTVKGAKVKDLPGSPLLKLAYVEFPVLLKILIPSDEHSNAFILIGPSLAFNTSSTLKVSGDGISSEVDVTNASDVDLGFVFGIEYGTRERGHAFFSLRYTIGLSNAYDDVASPLLSDLVDDYGRAPDLKNGVFSFLLGYEL